MERATKQRLVGGIVLLLGAAILLPIVLDGSGVPLVVQPMPEPPKVAGVEAISPKLDSAVQQADQAVNAAHEPSASDEEADVAPDAAAQPLKAETSPAVNNPAAAKTADKPVSAPVAIDKMAEAKLAADKLAADKALSEKLASEKAAAEKAKQEKLALEKQAQEKQAQEAKAAAEKAKQVAVKVESKPAAAVDLPNAWVVQVASLSAKDKADSLAQRLRQKSYRATVQQQGSMWKVFVGPELRKEVADTIKVKLANDPDLKLSGSWVQAYKP